VADAPQSFDKELGSNPKPTGERDRYATNGIKWNRLMDYICRSDVGFHNATDSQMVTQ